ncbi:MAG: MBL fold metallo-hydrolase [Syntrophomonadaceae bacterium]|nr:MBL fold metallo-hydrolase [Syntrophomonadaceae bacterium]
MNTKRLLLITLVLMLLIPGVALAAPTVILDGEQLIFTDAQPILEDGRTLVPLRSIFESMGATVSWDQDTKTATAVKGNTTVILPIGSTGPTINGQAKKLDVPAKIINGRTLAPLRFVGEAFGGTVGWDQASQTITIFSIPPSGTPPPTQDIKVHFIDVGQADSIYIQLPDNNDVLIDGGNAADGSTVVNYLRSQNVDDIELLIATHPHEDHIGGLPAVLNAFVVEQIIDSGKAASTKTYSNYAAAAQAEGCHWEEDMGQTFTWGNNTLQILTGQESWKNVNDYSVISRLDCGDIEFLFAGDAETPAELNLKGDISAEIIKGGHHGSNSSTSPGFLSRVNPEVAVISVGAGNTYGHPAAETLDKLQAAGVKVYRTDLNGNIIVTTDGKTYSVTTQKTSASTPIVQPAGTPPPLPITSQGKYVGSTKSNKYHYPDCRYAKQIQWANEIWFESKEEAEATGYVSCGVCKP